MTKSIVFKKENAAMRPGKWRSWAVVAVFAIMGISMLSSCATKHTVINRLESFSTELRNNSAYYTYDDWRNAVTYFGKIRKDASKYRYTPEERRRIGVLEGECARYMAKGVKDGMLNGIMGIGSEINGILQGILGISTEDN